ncbi:MAG: hypothetical protein HY242_09525 [Afipia sp.]|nr:hypothetical protein [Afipia sp.]
MTRLPFATALAALAAVFVIAFADGASAASCRDSFNTCVSRCKTNYASDKNCVSDHCTPKYATCKSTGCWQQGGDFGNVLTCNLDKR